MFEQMFTQPELALIAEALDARLDSDFGNEDVEGDIEILSPAHESALKELANKVVGLQEAKQD